MGGDRALAEIFPIDGGTILFNERLHHPVAFEYRLRFNLVIHAAPWPSKLFIDVINVFDIIDTALSSFPEPGFG